MDDYEVAVDLPRRLLVLTLRGFWNEATFDKFASEYAIALEMLQRQGGCRLALVDGLDFAVQAAEISTRFKELIDSLAPIAARRTATIVPAQLNRMQAKRTGDSINARIFTDRAEAEAWLFSDAA